MRPDIAHRKPSAKMESQNARIVPYLTPCRKGVNHLFLRGLDFVGFGVDAADAPMWGLNASTCDTPFADARCAPMHFANRSGRTGGDRTRDPNIKSVVLYQLSYSPRSKRTRIIHQMTDKGKAGSGMDENSSSCVCGVCDAFALPPQRAHRFAPTVLLPRSKSWCARLKKKRTFPPHPL